MELQFRDKRSRLEQAEVHFTAREILKDTFSEVSINGYRYTENEIWDVLLLASVNRTSINSVCSTLENVPSCNRLYGILQKELFENNTIEELEVKGNEIIQSALPRRLLRRGQRIAIDLVLIPFYGDEASPDICRSKAKASTTKFYCYASVYIIRKNKRCTVAFTFVKPDDSLLDVLKRLLKYIKELGIKIKRLYMDRAFARVDVFLYLDEKPYNSIIPLPKKGSRLKELQVGKKSYWTQYTMKSTKYGQITFHLAVACKYKKGKNKKHGVKYLFFALLGKANCTTSILQIAREYSHRFGIETSYRLMNQVRAKTTSTKPKFRLLLIIIAFFLINLWVWFKWYIILIRRRNNKPIIIFTLDTFSIFIEHHIESLYLCKNSLKL